MSARGSQEKQWPAALMVVHLVSRGLFIVPFSKDPVLNYFSMASVTPMRPSMGLHCNTLLWLQFILNRAPRQQKNVITYSGAFRMDVWTL